MFKINHIIFFCFFLIVFGCNQENELGPYQRFDFNFPEDCCSQNLVIESNSDANSCLRYLEDDDLILNAHLFIPCVFSPDSNTGNNISQSLFTNVNTIISSIKIYAQNGTLVYYNGYDEPRKYNYSWNGRYDGEIIDGPFQVIYKLECEEGTQLTASIFVCSLLCSKHTSSAQNYFENGLNADQLRWANQHDGLGGFDPTLFSDNCFE